MGRAREGEVWRTFSVSVPEDVRVLVEYAVELALLCGANSRVEALEYLAVSFVQSAEQENAEWNRRITTPDAKARMACLTRDGFRCRMCGTSKHLECHHIWSRHVLRDAGREELIDDPRCMITLCSKHHAEIQPRHADYVERFLALTGQTGYDALATPEEAQ